MSSLAPKLRTRWLVLADSLCILAFTCIGMLSHDAAIDGHGLARDTLPLLGGWLGAALLLQAYRRREVWRLVGTWAIGITVGVLVRALVLGRDLDGRQLALLVTTLGFSALLVGGARVALSRLSLAGVEARRSADR